MPRNPPWTDEENALVVADYFAMLKKDNARRPYNKTEHRRRLVSHLQSRSDRAIQFKYRNISSILKGLGEESISGYKPLSNVQKSLVDAVDQWLSENPKWLERGPPRHSVGMRGTGPLQIGPPPPLSDRIPVEEPVRQIARKFDAARRDERNRALGRAGEKRVLEHERSVLARAGCEDLADKVRWISKEEGDGAGYDIASFKPDGRERLIEVKTTNGWEYTPFYITRNELKVSEERPTEWVLCRLWNFSQGPRVFELHPPLREHAHLTEMMFRASFS